MCEAVLTKHDKYNNYDKDIDFKTNLNIKE